MISKDWTPAARRAIFGNHVTYTGRLHRELNEVEGDVAKALSEAYRAGLVEAAKICDGGDELRHGPSWCARKIRSRIGQGETE